MHALISISFTMPLDKGSNLLTTITVRAEKKHTQWHNDLGVIALPLLKEFGSHTHTHKHIVVASTALSFGTQE